MPDTLLRDTLLNQLINVGIKVTVEDSKRLASICGKNWNGLRETDLLLLQDHGLLDQHNFNDLIRHYETPGLAYAFLLLQQDGIFNPENRHAVIVHSSPRSLAQAFVTLQQENLLRDRKNRNTVIAHSDPSSLAQAFATLQKVDLFENENYRQAVIDHSNPSSLAQAFATIREVSLFENENYRKAVIAHSDPSSLAQAFVTLQQENLLRDRKNRNTVIAHSDPSSLAQAFIILNQKGLLNNEVCKESVCSPNNQKNLTGALAILKTYNLLTYDNITRLGRIYDYDQSATALNDTLNALINLAPNLITQENFETILDHACHSHWLKNSLAKALGLLRSLPPFPLSQEYFNRIVKEVHTEDNSTLSNAFTILAKGALLENEAYREAVNAHSKPDLLALAFVTLHEKKLLENAAYREAVNAHSKPDLLALAFVTLHEEKLLENAAYRGAVNAHSKPHDLARAFVTLHEKKLLENGAYREAFNAHSQPDLLVRAFVTLHEQDLLNNEECWKAVAEHSLPHLLARAFVTLHEKKLLENEECWKAVAAHQDPGYLANGIIFLQSADIINPLNLQAMIQKVDTKFFIETLKFVFNAQLLNQENFNRITHASPRDLAGILRVLEEADLLTTENISKVLLNYQPTLSKAIRLLSQEKLLSQFSLNYIFSHPHLDPAQCITKYCETMHQYQHIGKLADEYNPITKAIKSELQPAYALLYDYTKGKVGSIKSPLTFFESTLASCKRGLTGHWNRHHIDAIATILKDIREGSIKSRQCLSECLRGITNNADFNKNGSLAKRIMFIEQNWPAQEASDDDFADNRPTPRMV